MAFVIRVIPKGKHPRTYWIASTQEEPKRLVSCPIRARAKEFRTMEAAAAACAHFNPHYYKLTPENA